MRINIAHWRVTSVSSGSTFDRRRTRPPPGRCGSAGSRAGSWGICVPMHQTTGEKTSHFICHLVFQVWVWLTASNEGEKASPGVREEPLCQGQTKLKPRLFCATAVADCWSPSTKPGPEGESPPMPKADLRHSRVANSSHQRPCGGRGGQGRRDPRPPLLRGDSPAHATFRRGAVWTDGWTAGC